jgi:hypothetical protein
MAVGRAHAPLVRREIVVQECVSGVMIFSWNRLRRQLLDPIPCAGSVAGEVFKSK